MNDKTLLALWEMTKNNVNSYMLVLGMQEDDLKAKCLKHYNELERTAIICSLESDALKVLQLSFIKEEDNIFDIVMSIKDESIRRKYTNRFREEIYRYWLIMSFSNLEIRKEEVIKNRISNEFLYSIIESLGGYKMMYETIFEYFPNYMERAKFVTYIEDEDLKKFFLLKLHNQLNKDVINRVENKLIDEERDLKREQRNLIAAIDEIKINEFMLETNPLKKMALMQEISSSRKVLESTLSLKSDKEIEMALLSILNKDGLEVVEDIFFLFDAICLYDNDEELMKKLDERYIGDQINLMKRVVSNELVKNAFIKFYNVKIYGEIKGNKNKGLKRD